jgi:alpha-galactosidase
MPIVFNNETREFHLYNENISYIIKILKNNQLGHLYFGKKIHHRASFEHLLKVVGRGMTVCVFENDNDFSLENIKQEYPSYGTTDFRYPAHQIRQENGSRVTNFEFVSYNIFKGKENIKDLPATYVECEEEATSIQIKLYDSVMKTELILNYTIFENHSAIARSARFINNGDEKITITNAMSASFELSDDQFEMVQLSGAWTRERHVKVRPLQPGIQSIYSSKGASSSNHNPFIAIKRKETTENSGEAYAMNLVYSGNFLAQIEVDNFELTRMMIGINPFNFEWELSKGNSFETPEAIMVYSDEGLNKMSQTFHNLYNNFLVRGKWKNKPRPILINNWEATYFDFNEEKIVGIAKKAKELGIEMFVLDDGWFGKRNDDTSSLGDWYVNKEKLPNGIDGLSKKIQELGLKFGLWIEPEMINKESELYRVHPDWVIKTPDRNTSYGRNQFVLDFSRKEVVDYIYSAISALLRTSSVSYVKWDMNRNITEAFSIKLPAERQGEIMHRYILGVYDLYERLISDFPDILFESCSGGGGRFDPGMLYYAPQTWTSDDTDAIERLKIQYGTSFAYPLSSMGSHVSAAPNHQVKRLTSIDTRANVALFGTFGYELDLNKISEAEKAKVIKQVEFCKKYRELIVTGDFYRLISPFEKDYNITSWMVVSKDKKRALVGYYQALNYPNQKLTNLKLVGLDENILYTVKQLNLELYGDEMMNLGLVLSNKPEELGLEINENDINDFISYIFEIEEK